MFGPRTWGPPLVLVVFLVSLFLLGRIVKRYRDSARDSSIERPRWLPAAAAIVGLVFAASLALVGVGFYVVIWMFLTF
jgi:hypothetical protein